MDKEAEEIGEKEEALSAEILSNESFSIEQETDSNTQALDKEEPSLFQGDEAGVEDDKDADSKNTIEDNVESEAEEVINDVTLETEQMEEEQADEEKIQGEIEEKKEITMQGKSEQRGNIIFYALLALMLIGALIFRNYWANTFGGVVVDGASMNQTLQDGDELLMKKLKDVDDLQRGDVIVVEVSGYEEFKDSSTKYLIKRLIAMEGDKVRCVDGQIEIWYAGTTGYVVLEETYAYYFQSKANYDFAEYEVGEDEIFFLGDNRQNSCDSRYKEVGGSHLNKLYKEQDVYGVVPDWAIENRSWLQKIFFWKNKL